MNELNFKEFLEARGAVGGAFGKTGRPQGRYNVPSSGTLDSSASYNSRIAAGKGIEGVIRQRMAEELGMPSSPSTSAQDKNLGIDGWFTSLDGGATKTSVPFQIKARKNASGNDILWEAVKPWNENLVSTFEQIGENAFTGKDMKSKARFLISVSNDGGTIRMRYVSEAIGKCKEMVKEFIHNYRSTGRTYASTRWGQIRLVKDPSGNNATYNTSFYKDVSKLNCFLNPDSFEWKKDFRLKQPIGAV